MQMVDRPAVLFVLLLIVFTGVASFATLVLRRFRPLTDEERDDFSIVQTATLTLFALLIGFTLSMAVGRYDQRKNLEEEEANAIGTEYLRADLLDNARATEVKGLLREYVALRISFYRSRDTAMLAQIDIRTAELEGRMWNGVRDAARAMPDPVTALAVAGMNDVINSHGYTTAAWRNRVPTGAWSLMIAIALFSILLQGYGVRGKGAKVALLLVLPLTASLSLSLIADVDSPRWGIIRVHPQNMLDLERSIAQ
ncbi:hypothetical protein AB4Z48_39645 [Cupriavidus sp. 2TAF22]|uniref:bestrophin-like domain n=1 Tax=unclassified Cupriavidus TaxID=2640874 RepID=UPI003F937164